MEYLKKIKRFVIMNDWTWSILFAFLCYMFLNYAPPVIFGTPMAYFAINWIQPLIATAGIMSGLFAIARLGMWFNIRKLHNYMYGTKQADGEYKNYSSIDFKVLTPCQRLFILFFLLLFFFVVATIVFLKFIPLSAPA